MLKTKTKCIYDDYAAMDDDKRYELIEGELYMVPAPGFYHQTILNQTETTGFSLIEYNPN